MMELLRFFGGFIVLCFILFTGVFFFYKSEMAFIKHFVPDKITTQELSNQESSFIVYDINGEILEKKIFKRNDPLTFSDIELYTDWFRILDQEFDGSPLPVSYIDALFLDHNNIQTSAVKSYLVNKKVDKLLVDVPLDGLRLRLLRYLTAEKVVKSIGFKPLYMEYAEKVSLEGRVYGIKAASVSLFNVNFYKANYKEQAFLFSILKNPSFYTQAENFAVAERRANTLLYYLYKNGVVQRQEYVSVRDNRLISKEPKDPETMEVEYLKAVKEELKKYGVKPNEPCIVHTYFDPEKTALLRRVVGKYMKKQDEGIESAFVLLDYERGGIVAMTGAREGKSVKRAFFSRRQTGSTFKPIVYAAAFENGIKPTDNVNDKKYTYGKTYSPRNFEELYFGNIPARKGLVFSLNNATIQIAIRTGLVKVAKIAKSMGMNADVKGYYAMPLGVFPTSPANLAQVYATLGSYGLRRERGLIEKIEFPDGRVFIPGEKAERVLSEKAAFQTLYVMQDVPRIGTAKRKGLIAGTAAKTGTTDKYKDAWTAAVFPPYVAVAWLGYDTDKSMGEKGTGGSKAAPLIAAVQKEIYENGHKVVFEKPDGVNLFKVTWADGKLVNDKCAKKRSYFEALAETDLPDECVK